jgi:1,2-diacylglycerol 3-beta-glucosyltransferase
MVTVDLTWLTRLVLLVVVYYGVLFAIPLVRIKPRLRRGLARGDLPFVVLVIPAHNEEAVIGQTLVSLEKLDYPHRLILVMNDGSEDATGAVARRFAHQGRVLVVDRDAAVAGQGKGAVLNHAFAIVSDLVARGDPCLGGTSADRVVVGVMDADGQLESHALTRIAPYFCNRRVGAVQIGVRIANADDNVFTRMQDMEFVGFSSFVQQARDAFGSVGLGGNGQFTRLSALQSLSRQPWTDCLTEDLDLGLSLVEHAWRIRFCPSAYVAQQGLRRLRPLLRQRTRWFHGHYQCWRHIPTLMRSRAKLRTKVDLLIYLVMIGFIVVIFAALVATLASSFGLLGVENHVMDRITNTPLHNAVLELISIGPLVGLVVKYQRHARNPLRLWEIPAYAVAFALYTYVFIVSQLWAWARIAARRGNWAKTPRVVARPAV